MRREAPALARASREHSEQITHSKTLQFLFARQWSALHRYARERNITLFGDMPIYIALDSADAWGHPELLLTDSDGTPTLVAGVPPDYFSADGQLWGNPLYDWHYHEQHGFAWWQRRLAHACRQADLVRIDHFRGFESFWAIPADAPTARHGHWLAGPGDTLFAALRSTLGELPLVAEDLGIITPAVEALRDRQNLPGMRVLQFELTAESFAAGALPVSSVCYTGTHDNDTTAGWFRGSPNDLRSADQIAADQATILERTGGSPETIAADVINTAFATPAWLAIAPLQDYLGLGSEARLNRPGTTEGNWQWRLKTALSGEVIEAIAGQVEASGR
jgi:4-alpha-glucanotransferase